MAQSSWLTTVSKRVGDFFGIATAGGLVAGALITLVALYQVAQECFFDGIVLENVVVPPGDGGLTLEMATQQVATYIYKIQRTGAREWRQHDLDEGAQQAVSIQIPGSSLNVESIVHELASLFPHRRRALKISITPNPSGTGYVAAIAIIHRNLTTRTTCEGKSSTLERMFECLALEAMKVVDPLFAASYVLSLEEEDCKKFQGKHFRLTKDRVADEKEKIKALRDDCNFSKTRALVAEIIHRENGTDLPWVSYIYGKLHLARAEAVAKVDPEAQWYEFDRAISRFQTIPVDKVPASALAIQMETYVQYAISKQENALNLSEAPGNALQVVVNYRKNAAMDDFTKADCQVQMLSARSEEFHRPLSRVFLSAKCQEMITTSKPAPVEVVDDSRVDALIAFERGLILYREWIKDREFHFAKGEEDEKQLLAAESFFETSRRHGNKAYKLYMVWGNTLLALRSFDAAVERYRQAGDLEPTKYDPFLNAALATLEKSKFNVTGKFRDLFDALRQTSNYLLWISEGGPYTYLEPKIDEALDRVDDGNVKRAFQMCRQKYTPNEGPESAPGLLQATALKLCVDSARNELGILVALEDSGSMSARARQ